jgi:hypothetical protein
MQHCVKQTLCHDLVVFWHTFDAAMLLTVCVAVIAAAVAAGFHFQLRRSVPLGTSTPCT